MNSIAILRRFQTERTVAFTFTLTLPRLRAGRKAAGRVPVEQSRRCTAAEAVYAVQRRII